MLTVVVSSVWSDGREVGDYGNVIIVRYNNEVIFEEADTMEPEDAIFTRDLAWIKEAINAAYSLGAKDGFHRAKQ